MPEKMQKKILEIITFTPGVIGLAPADLTEKTSMLSKDKWNEGLSLIYLPKGLELTIAIIVEIDTNVKLLAKEIFSSIQNIFKSSEIKLKDLRIYVRGVR